MSRKRYVSSEISVDERLAEIAAEDPQSALMWPWFLLLFDDWGRAEMNATRIKLKLFPAFPFLPADIERAIEAFSSKGLLFLYEVDGVRYGAVRPKTWLKYQVYLKGAKRATTASSFPSPPEDTWSEADREALAGMTKPNDYKRRNKGGEEGCLQTDEIVCRQTELSADKKDCLQTKGIVCRQSGLSVPSPSPSPSPSKDKIKYSCPSGAEETDPEGRQSETGDPPAPEAETLSSLEGAARRRWEEGTKASFEEVFWGRYPRKDKKADALKAFRHVFPFGQPEKRKLARFRHLQEHLAKALCDFAEREDVKYIPLPATWLRGQDFDEPPERDELPQRGPMFAPCEGDDP